MTPRGFKDASSDAEMIASLWRHYPGSLVGIRTGEHFDLAMIDVDPRQTRNDRLFGAACRFVLLNPPVAELVLTSAAHFNGLVRDDGLAQVMTTIASGLKTSLAQSSPNHGES
jgi:hypothetical protein